MQIITILASDTVKPVLSSHSKLRQHWSFETGRLFLQKQKSCRKLLTLKALNLKMDCSNFEILPVYMNYSGKFNLILIYNKQSRPLIRGLPMEPSDLGLHNCLQMYINLFPALQGLRDISALL